METRLDTAKIIDNLTVDAGGLELAVKTLKSEQDKLLADWELEEKVLGHLASLPQKGDVNIYIRYMQASINCGKRFPKEVRQLGKSIDRLATRLEQVKKRLERIRAQQP